MSACLSNAPTRSGDSTGNSSGGTTTFGASSNDLDITNVNPSDSTGTASVYFDTTTTNQITEFCDDPAASSGANSCFCRFQWNELNDNGGTTITVSRTVDTTVDVVRTSSVDCDLPTAYAGEIVNGTGVSVTVIGSGVQANLSISPYTFTKNAASSTVGDFVDAEGNQFVNILRYSCFETYRRGTTITSSTYTFPKGETAWTALSATQFCVTGIDGSGGGTGCESSSSTNTQVSADANYYNLFVQSRNKADIQLKNNRYFCPKVYETIGVNNIGVAPTPNEAGADHWPLDSTYALAADSSAEFNVGVVAPSMLGVDSEPITNPTSCSDESTGTATAANNDSISGRCIGFARTPNSNGSCPTFTNAIGATVRTYRLRRYVALYPATYNTNGAPLSSISRAMDVTYILDRPVDSGDPQNPYSMLGPKPCPYAYFDKLGLTTAGDNTTNAGVDGNATYRGTNVFAKGLHDAGEINNTTAGDLSAVAVTSTNSLFVNPDGTELPRTDDLGANSCAAMIPIYQRNNLDRRIEKVSLATIHDSNPEPGFKRKFIRPREPWIPRYVEDTSFRACAPRSSNFIDPPIHVARDNRGEMSYCTLAYPTQNINLGTFIADQPGQIAALSNFTSPTIKGTVATPNCMWTDVSAQLDALGAGVVPVGATARHLGANYDFAGPATTNGDNVTCDRTVVNSTGLPSYFPLSAHPRAIEHALINEPSYNCTISYDDGGPKSAQGLTPSGGCCESTLFGPNLTPGPPTNTLAQSDFTGHLEPGLTPAQGCNTPDY